MQEIRHNGLKAAYYKRPVLAGFVSVLWLGVIIWGLKGLWSLFRHRDLFIAGVSFLLAGLLFFAWYKLHNWALSHPKSVLNTNNNNQRNGNFGHEYTTSLKDEIELFVEQYLMGAAVATQKHLLEDGIMPKSKSWLVHDELLYFFLSYAGILCFENTDNPESAAKGARLLVFVAATKYWKYFHNIVEESSEEQLYNRIERDFEQRSQGYYSYHDEYMNKTNDKDMTERFCYDLEKLIDCRDAIWHIKILRYVSIVINTMHSHDFWRIFP